MGVAPDIEQRLTPDRIDLREVVFGERERILVMAGRVPGKKILRQAVAVGVLRCTAVEDAAGAGGLLDLRGIRAAGIGHAHDGIPGHILENAAVFHDFVNQRRSGHFVHPAVANGMAGDFVAGVDAAGFGFFSGLRRDNASR